MTVDDAVGFLGMAPAADPAAVAVFLPVAADALCSRTSFAGRCEALPGPESLTVCCVFFPAACGSTLLTLASSLQLASAANSADSTMFDAASG